MNGHRLKATAFPPDARLYHKMRLALVRAAKQRNIWLRQSFVRVGKKALIWQAATPVPAGQTCPRPATQTQNLHGAWGPRYPAFPGWFNWRIYYELAQRLITRARKLYAQEPLGVTLDDTVYALDATTIDLCLSVFNWAPFRKAKAAIKLHTLLDLRGSIPSFIHITSGKVHDVNVLNLLLIEPGAFYVMDRGYLDFKRLYRIHAGGAFFVTRAKQHERASVVFCAGRSFHGPHLRPNHCSIILGGCGVSASKTRARAKRWCF